MKSLVVDRETKEGEKGSDEYAVGKIYGQSNQSLDSQSNLMERFCLLCKRRTAVAVTLP
jgi:hypothetical protein